jgi:integrase
MASLTKRPNGRWEIHYQDENDRRQTVRIGKMSERNAVAIKIKVEDLIASKLSGGAIKDETALWADRIAKPLAMKLFKKGLIDSRELKEEEDRINEQAQREAEETAKVRLLPYLTEYVASRVDLKPRTAIKFNATIDYLVAHFGADKPLVDITEGDAEDFRIFLLSKKLAENTVRKHTQIVKQFFNKAIKKRILENNPFRDLKATVQANPERFFFVDAATSKAVLESLPSLQWKLIFALCRWGGLRCPSEVLALRWVDVDWEKGRIRIKSEKTEHHTGKGSRDIPLFPELKPILEQAWHEAEEGEVFVITKYRNKEQNLRTRLAHYIVRAGFKPWPKLFQNMRSTRETELAQDFPMHVVCKWIGNSEAIAAKHYLQLTDAHFAKANQPKSAPENPQQNPQQSGLENACQGGTVETANPQISRDFAYSHNVTNEKVAEEGLEQPQKQRDFEHQNENATKYATLFADSAFQKIAELWQTSGDSERAKILAFTTELLRRRDVKT